MPNAADFFTVEVWCPRGLVTFYVFFAIELATRRVSIVGTKPGPNVAWMMQAGRNLGKWRVALEIMVPGPN